MAAKGGHAVRTAHKADMVLIVSMKRVVPEVIMAAAAVAVQTFTVTPKRAVRQLFMAVEEAVPHLHLEAMQSCMV